MKRISLAALLLCFAAGCWILPSGDPPPGNIVSNVPPAKKKFTKPSEAFDYMVSAMTTILLEKCPGEELNISVNNRKCGELTSAIFRESSKISGNRISDQKSNWEIKSALVGDNIHLSLHHNGIQIWEEVIYSPF